MYPDLRYVGPPEPVHRTTCWDSKSRTTCDADVPLHTDMCYETHNFTTSGADPTLTQTYPLLVATALYPGTSNFLTCFHYKIC